MNPRSLANWAGTGHGEAGTYSLSRACHNHYRIATTGARSLGKCIAGWHLALLWLSSRENTCLRCRQMGLHYVLMWLFGHPLLWLVCFICSEFVTYSYNDKLRVTNFEYNERVLEGAAFFPVVYTGCKRYRLPKKYGWYISVYLSEMSKTILFYLVL